MGDLSPFARQPLEQHERGNDVAALVSSLVLAIGSAWDYWVGGSTACEVCCGRLL